MTGLAPNADPMLLIGVAANGMVPRSKGRSGGSGTDPVRGVIWAKARAEPDGCVNGAFAKVAGCRSRAPKAEPDGAVGLLDAIMVRLAPGITAGCPSVRSEAIRILSSLP